MTCRDKLAAAICKRMNALKVPENPVTMDICARFIDANGRLTLMVKNCADGAMEVGLIKRPAEEHPIANAPGL